MTVTVEIPDELAEALTPANGNLSRVVIEAVVLEGYRRDMLSEAAVRRLLGFGTREEAQGFLKNHDVCSHYGTSDLDHDLAEAARYVASQKARQEQPAALRAE